MELRFRKQWGKISQTLIEDQHNSNVAMFCSQKLRCFKQKALCFSYKSFLVQLKGGWVKGRTREILNMATDD